MNSSTYKIILKPFPKEEQKEIMRGFYTKHRDFRDTVQIPTVISFISAILIQGAIFVYWTGTKAFWTITPLMFIYFFLTKLVLGKVLGKRNQFKLKQFIEERMGEPVN